MAIKRLDPKAIFKVISAIDDAIELDKPEDLISEELDQDGKPKIKPTRYEEYMEEANFNESKLKFKEGMQPDRFLLRPLTADELADINARYMFIDTVAKKMIYTNRNKMFLEMFVKAYQGIQGADGVVVKVEIDAIPYPVQIEMGAVTSLIATLGKNEKKP